MAAEIRLAKPDDGGAAAEIYAPAVLLGPISFETEAPDAIEMRGRIEATLRTYPWLVCEQGGRVVGYAYATQHRTRAAYRWSVDAAVYVRDGFRGCGVGRGLYTSLFRILAAQGFHNAYAGITLPNPASVALHESVGFRRVGVYERVGYKLGAWHDVGWWGLQLRPHEHAPPPPLDLPAVAGDSAFGAMVGAGVPLVRLA